MTIAYHEVYVHPLPENHRFPMEKYSLLAGQLKRQGYGADASWIEPGLALERDIQRVHDEGYWNRLKSGQISRHDERASGFKWSPQLVRREQTIMEGTLQCARRAAEGEVALNIAGGTHHAFKDRPEGFCLLNDIMIAALHLQHEKLAKNILVVDLDVHQGNGTASMAKYHPNVFTFSMHGAQNYPFRKEESDLDIALPTGTTDQAYLSALDEGLTQAFSLSKPEVVFYQCGVDVLETDKLGKLSLTAAGCSERDRMVLDRCKSFQVGVACSMGGGYSASIGHIVDAHMATFHHARNLWS